MAIGIRLAGMAGAAGLLALTLSTATQSAPPKALPAPEFRDVSVHDPSVVHIGDYYYVFGSHLAAAKSRDLRKWDLIAEGVRTGNPLIPNVLDELKDAFDWSQVRSLWAPDVIKLRDGRYYMYYCSCKGDSPRSALGYAVSDKPEGPYRNLGILLKSGMWGQSGEDGEIYDPRLHPNVVDPALFFDAKGALWMTYGSFSGGIFIMKMDPLTGKPLPGQGYGKRLMGGNHSRIEAPYILYHPKTRYYYLFVSFGGLDDRGGYNIRVARSRRPDGPYFDAEGNGMADVKADPARPLFDDRSIEPYGVKLMGNFVFEPSGKAGNDAPPFGYVSPGHNSACYVPSTGKQFLTFHTRFPNAGNFHQVRAHQMFMNSDGWPVVAPCRYAGETAGKVAGTQVAGEYRYVNHGKAITADITRSTIVRLNPNGTLSGAARGTWKLSGDNLALITIDGNRYDGVFARLWDGDSAKWVTAFTALSKKGVAVWGIRTN